MIIKPRPFRKLRKGHWASKGLVGCWLMNEGSGNTVQDLSGNGHHGVSTAPVWATGKYGSAINPSANNGSFLTDVYTGNYDNGLTVIAWVKPSTIAVGDDFIFDDTNGGNGTALRRGDDKAEFFCFSPAASIVLSTTSFVADEWACIAGVHDTTNRIYFNGVLEATSAATSLAIDDSASPVRIGSTFDDIDNFAGLISHVYLYNHAKSASEISQLYQEPFCMFDYEPIELWSAATIGGEAPEGNAAIMTTNTGFWGATF